MDRDGGVEGEEAVGETEVLVTGENPETCVYFVHCMC